MRPGFSEDGYIIDQNFFGAYRYRGLTSDYNGCGWIAAYDLRRAQGHDVDFEQVHRDMNAMFPFQIPGPTPMRKLLRYLARHGRYRLIWGKRRSLAAAGKAQAGIIRYLEEDTPHFVPFVRTDGGYRFFNVSDGQEELVCSMDDFFRDHCRKGFVRVVLPA